MVTDDADGSTQEGQATEHAPPAPAPQIPPLRADSIPSNPAARQASESEAKALSDGKLESIATQNSHRRREHVRTMFHIMKLVHVAVLGVLVLAAIIIVAIHHMTPWSFLSPEQLSTLQTMLASSVVTGIATFGAKNVIKDL